ncbi:MAG: glycerophosphodiester phosphodiesterase, partial [archaeon]|nr:glycerophosphodiester phosphodiesterase [archaeon]
MKTLIFGHRGACGYEYENTISSFEKAIAFGADGLETDCWLIEDGEVVIHHDKAVQSQVIG